MGPTQTWTVHKKDGTTCSISTIIGLGPLQALANAGLMEQEVFFIRPDSIAAVEDIRAWREGAA